MAAPAEAPQRPSEGAQWMAFLQDPTNQDDKAQPKARTGRKGKGVSARFERGSRRKSGTYSALRRVRGGRPDRGGMEAGRRESASTTSLTPGSSRQRGRTVTHVKMLKCRWGRKTTRGDMAGGTWKWALAGREAKGSQPDWTTSDDFRSNHHSTPLVSLSLLTVASLLAEWPPES